jgi:GTP diphosphokinase / guanosine-3',5'-bis(diphosphate) 3'-diphosphatase
VLLVNELVQRVRNYHPSSDLSVIERAYQFAEYAHRSQVRKSGDPYFVHPVRVAEELVGMQLDVASICAGLLHDVVEDTESTVDDIQRHFGPEVAELVDGLTKLGKINFTSREDRQSENFRKMIVAMAKDVRVLLVKLCDRLDNMRTLEHMKDESQERISRETVEIYAPLAHRLGMYQVKNELEDLAYRYLEPATFVEVETKLQENSRERGKYIEGVSRTIGQILGERDFACQVSGRPRHTTSLLRKMKSLHCAVEQIPDQLAFQVRVESISQCYTALGVLHAKWTPVPGRFKDFIALPKPNRYQSLHTTVLGPGRRRIELQIRTHDMHRVAEKGVVAHWEQRANLSGRGQLHDAGGYAWLREIEIYERDLQDPAEFLSMLKSGLFVDEVYVFTPKGDVRVFPRGATPLDFAYSIHTELGDHCEGARVNGLVVPIRYKLRNGDLVEVLSNPKLQPEKEWLDCCVTPRAISRIRTFTRAQHRVRSINLGRELLENAMHEGGMSFGKLLKNQELIEQVLAAFSVPDADELLLAVGYGRIQAEQVVTSVRKFRQTGSQPENPIPELKEGPIEKLVRKVTRGESNAIRVDGRGDVPVRFAACCNPVPGDPIIGFIVRGKGVTVHLRDCKKAFNRDDPKRRVEVSWGTETKILRRVSLRVTTRNSSGILAKLGQTFSAHGINISEANCRASDDGNAQNTFTFVATDVSQLRTVMRALAKVTGVLEVERA